MPESSSSDMKRLRNSLFRYWIACLVILSLLFEYIRGLDLSGSLWQSLRDDLTDIVLSKANQFAIVIALSLWHVALLWIKVNNPRFSSRLPGCFTVLTLRDKWEC